MSEELTAEMIRLYCDGELSPEQVDQLQEHLHQHPEDRARVEFERKLQQHVHAVMQVQCRCAPPELASGIHQRLTEAAADEPQTSAGQVASRQSKPPPATTASTWSLASWFHAPRQANIYAVAASLALVAGAVLFGIFGRPIDAWRRPQLVDLVADAVPFVATEHGRCAGNGDARANKATFRDPHLAAAELSSWLGATVSAVPLTDRLNERGWEFFGGGYCGVPASKRSGHLIFTRDDQGSGPAILSVFVVPDDGGYSVLNKGAVVPLQPDNWHKFPAGERFSREVWIYSDGYLIYLMVSCSSHELRQAAGALQDALRQAGP